MGCTPVAPGGLELPVAGRSHVPSGWKVIEQITGDLDGDGRTDLVFVCEEQDPRKIAKHPDIEGRMVNTNRRTMVVLLADQSGFRKIGESAKFVMPSYVDEFDSYGDCFAGLVLARGVLEVRFLWISAAGTSSGSLDIYKFRLEQGRLRLIGSESESWHRGSGEKDRASVNYLTGRRKLTSGLNEFDSKLSHPKHTWESFDAKKPIFLEDMPAGGQNR
jgi:hypothetical protein